MHTYTSPFPVDDCAQTLANADWIVDALLGTGATGAPRAPLDQVIDLINASTARKLAVDIPSGLDCDTGEASSHCVRADHTCTFVAAKPGLVAEAASSWIGALHVLDIGAPARLLKQYGIEAPKGSVR
jgi:NAD(P)H-hydrate epimerase